MINNFKPLLAFTIEDFSELKFPLLASSKIDGIRCIVMNGIAYSRSLKPIVNKHIQSMVSSLDPDLVFDGELFVGENFQHTTSAVMSIKGEPNFTYLIFDCIRNENLNEPFASRVDFLNNLTLPTFCRKLEQRWIMDSKDLIDFYHKQLELGFEGVIVREPYKHYKFGRSTKKENIIGKIKPFADDEFEIVGFESYKENTNVSELNELGYKHKSTKQEGKIEKELLGSFVCKHPCGEFSVGSGLTLEQRHNFWQEKESLIGKKIKVKYLNYGTKELPRNTVFLGFRSEDDFSEKKRNYSKIFIYVRRSFCRFKICCKKY